MKYPYHIEYNQFGSAMMRLPKEIEHVAIFLFCDVYQSISWYYFSALDDVLQDRLPYQEAGGNVYRLEMRSDFTQVIDTLAPDKTNDRCAIETSELREIIDIWCQAIEKEPVVLPQVAA